MSWILAVCDRTGRLLDPVRESADERFEDVEVVRVPDGPGLEHDQTDADVLVVGARELTAAGLRRVGMWLDQHPGAVALAHLDPGVASRPSVTELRTAGVFHSVEASWTDLHQHLGDVLEDLANPPVDPTQAALAEVAAVAAGLPFGELAHTGPDGGPLFGRAANVPDGAPAPPSSSDVAYVLTVASASGGSGKTFYAANLATHLADLGHRVLLVDLDLQFGEVGAALQIKHPYSIYDGLYDGNGDPLPDDALDRHLGELVHHCPLGFDVLLAPRDPTVGERISAEDVELVIAVTTLQYDVVIVDTPPSLTETVLSVLDRSDVVVVLSTLDVPSLRNLTSFLDVLSRIDVGRDRVRLMLNKVESDIGIDVSQAQEAFGGRFVATLPAGKSASRSINTGTVVLRSEPKGPVAKALLASMQTVVPPELLPAVAPVADGGPAVPPDAAAPARGLRSLFRRRPVSGGNP